MLSEARMKRDQEKGQGNKNHDPSPLTRSGVDIPPLPIFPCPHIPLPFPYHARRLNFAHSVGRSKESEHFTIA